MHTSLSSARRLVAAWLLLTAGLALHLDASAGGVVPCVNCADSRAAALQSGTGLTVVVDPQQQRLSAFNVEYDRELQRYRALPTPAPAEITRMFNRILGLPNAHLGPGTQFVPQAFGRGAVVPVHPDDPQMANGITFPDAMKALNAYDVVQSATYRSQLELAIGRAFSGADSQQPAWNSLATTISSIVLSWVSKLFGVDTVTYVITWRDGSQTRLVISPDAVDKARYVTGESVDAQGNRIPDGAASNTETGEGYVGNYHFNNDDDYQRWLDSAHLYGVQIEVNPGAAPSGPICRWDGRQLHCQVPR
ncbi:hypothetical protein C1922_12380 [Stenotrophomonas sp. ZAC14D2_NAIMI4_7]|uniref:hypothetical protein n=1 Tax=Stenotrophomonas sp. ZAC14D2_NAIMI4_7 TaxID=2072405 RepID=UPI000D53E642|nr:hypothetical protein [Stenotrophomonas sp. ZAC14D2_NAIMI4_7]AWH18039.1 hypothetical protein C1922_12380 [Stenotrophomonas sp. ZAC14D2_NAIMI4_7]